MFNRVFVESEGKNDFYASLGKDVGSIMSVPMGATKNDLIVLSGGIDINPVLYGEEPHPHTQVQSKTLSRRDKLCVELWEFAVSRGIPLLGICRGHQHIAAMCGIKLIQHLPQSDHGRRKILLEGKFWASAPKCHHQAVPVDSRINILSTTTTKEGLSFVEAFETEKKVLAVQGHPEWCDPDEVFPTWVRNKLWSYL